MILVSIIYRAVQWIGDSGQQFDSPDLPTRFQLRAYCARRLRYQDKMIVRDLYWIQILGSEWT